MQSVPSHAGSFELGSDFPPDVLHVSLRLSRDRCVSSVRVPDDSDSQSGVIRQRQNCLESRRVEGQELPVLTLAPCAGTGGVPAVNQVGHPKRGVSLSSTS